ncbi:MAG: hypothetical protein M3Q33_06620, partial [Acidobacteriota bacterium]|nr:hypothetical protein [Acidobacteriota bacterium]
GKPEESFNWFLKTFKEEQQQRQSKADEQPSQKQEIKMLRLIKFFEPPVEKLMEISKAELELSLLAVADILEKLEANGEIVLEVVTKSGGDANALTFKEKIAKITPKGQTRIDNGG